MARMQPVFISVTRTDHGEVKLTSSLVGDVTLAINFM
jgi:hypothetical protein